MHHAPHRRRKALLLTLGLPVLTFAATTAPLTPAAAGAGGSAVVASEANPPAPTDGSAPAPSTDTPAPGGATDGTNVDPKTATAPTGGTDAPPATSDPADGTNAATTGAVLDADVVTDAGAGTDAILTGPSLCSVTAGLRSSASAAIPSGSVLDIAQPETGTVGAGTIRLVADIGANIATTPLTVTVTGKSGVTTTLSDGATFLGTPSFERYCYSGEKATNRGYIVANLTPLTGEFTSITVSVWGDDAHTTLVEGDHTVVLGQAALQDTKVIDGGIGVRFDENLLDPLLDGMNLEPTIDSQLTAFMLDEAEAGNPAQDNVASTTTSVSLDTALGFDFVAPTSTYPNGSIVVTIDVQNPVIDWRVSPNSWVDPDTCHITYSPADFNVKIYLKVENDPAAPLTVAKVTTTAPTETKVADLGTTGGCWGYLIDDVVIGLLNTIGDFFTGSSGTAASDPTAMVKEQVEGMLAGLPFATLTSAEPILTVTKITADDHGLTAQITSDLDQGRRWKLESSPTGPILVDTWDVSGTIDAGVTSDLDDVLAQRTTTGGVNIDATLSFDPNFWNQVMKLSHRGGAYTFTRAIDGADIEPSLFGMVGTRFPTPSPIGASYADDRWTVTVDIEASPYLETGARKPSTGCATATTSDVCFEILDDLNVPHVNLTYTNAGVDVATIVVDLGEVGMGFDAGWGFAHDLGTSNCATTCKDVSVLRASADAGNLLTSSTAAGRLGAASLEQVLEIVNLSFGKNDRLCAGTKWIENRNGTLPGDDRFTIVATIETKTLACNVVLTPGPVGPIAPIGSVTTLDASLDQGLTVPGLPSGLGGGVTSAGPDAPPAAAKRS